MEKSKPFFIYKVGKRKNNRRKINMSEENKWIGFGIIGLGIYISLSGSQIIPNGFAPIIGVLIVLSGYYFSKAV